MIVQLGMQYLLDRFPPPASAGSCSCFLSIVRIWWVTVLPAGPGRAGQCGIGEATDLYLLGFYLVALGLCCGIVHHPGRKINTSLLDLVAMSPAKPQPGEFQRALIENPAAFPRLLTHPLWSFASKLPWGHAQVCPLAFTYTAVTCTSPSCNDPPLSNVRPEATWSQSLCRPFVTSNSPQATCLQPLPQVQANTYGAFTSRLDNPGVKEDTDREPGGKKQSAENKLAHYKLVTQRNLREETNSLRR